jgi:hypothetical protein
MPNYLGLDLFRYLARFDDAADPSADFRNLGPAFRLENR